MKTTTQNLKRVILTFFLTFSLIISAQVGIGTTVPAGGSLLDIESTNKGIVVPRLNIADLTTIAPVTGGSTESLLVYNTNITTGKGFYYWDSSKWVMVGSDDWKLTGNAGTTPGTNYLGTSDAQDLRIHTNGIERMRVTANGEVAINETVVFPGDQFTVSGTNWPINAYGTGTSASTPLHSAIYTRQGTGGDGASAFVEHFGDNGAGIQLQMQEPTASGNAMTVIHSADSDAILVQSNFDNNTRNVTSTVGSFTYGGTDRRDHVGVAGVSEPSNNWGYGVTGRGLYFGVYSYGDSGASGTKTFAIDHPQDPANKILKHFSIESNEVLNLYRGTAIFDANGKATIELPEYYDAVNKNASYQLTPVGAAMPNLFIEKEVENQEFVIAGGIAGKKVSWVLTAERNDPYLQQNPDRRNVIIEKIGERKGKYISPELYGLPKEKRMDYSKSKSVSQKQNKEDSKKTIDKE